MDTLQCAVVLAKLERFDWEIAQRRAVAARYAQGLTGAPGLQLPTVRSGRDSAWAQYTVRVENRSAAQATLIESGVPTAVHYPRPVHHQPAYADLACPSSCPKSVIAADQVLSLPISADLGAEDQGRVMRELLEAIKEVPRMGAGQRG